MRRYTKISFERVVGSVAPKPLVELTPERIEKLKSFSDVMLSILSLSAIVTMTVVAPNAIQCLKIFEKKKGKKLTCQKRVDKVSRAFYYLKESGWATFERRGNDYKITLTKEGKEKVRLLNLENIVVDKPQAWDGKFWQVAADIPTKEYRRGADLLRQKLKDMGFFPLQRTLWFYPYDPRIEIEFITRHYGIFNFVTVMKIEELDPSDFRIMKNYFKAEGTI